MQMMKEEKSRGQVFCATSQREEYVMWDFLSVKKEKGVCNVCLMKASQKMNCHESMLCSHIGKALYAQNIHTHGN